MTGPEGRAREQEVLKEHADLCLDKSSSEANDLGQKVQIKFMIDR